LKVIEARKGIAQKKVETKKEEPKKEETPKKIETPKKPKKKLEDEDMMDVNEDEYQVSYFGLFYILIDIGKK
jgi:hypothetical protein